MPQSRKVYAWRLNSPTVCKTGSCGLDVVSVLHATVMTGSKSLAICFTHNYAICLLLEAS